MSNNKIELENKDLFQDVSEQEQETISAGSYAFFLQLTRETSLVKNLINVPNGNQNTSVNQVSEATFSQLTIAADSSFFNTGSSRSRERRYNNFLRFLWRLLT
jgi:hypothetical protein